AAREYACDGEAVERPPVVFDEPAPAVLDAENFRAFVQHRAAHDGAYDCVEAGAVPAARHDSNTQTHSRKNPRRLKTKPSIDLSWAPAYNRATGTACQTT